MLSENRQGGKSAVGPVRVSALLGRTLRGLHRCLQEAIEGFQGEIVFER